MPTTEPPSPSPAPGEQGTVLAVLPPPSTFLVCLIDAGATAPAELGAVRRLVIRGHRVVVLADASMAADVLAVGAEHRPWIEAPSRPDRRPESDPIRAWECVRRTDLVDRLIDRRLVGPAAGYAADTARALGVVRPDAVLATASCLGAMVAAESCTVPLAVLVPGPYRLPARGMPPAGSGLRPARTPVGWAHHRLVAARDEQTWGRGLSGLNSVRSTYGLAPVTTVHDHLERADRHIVMTSEAFDFPAAVPDRVRYVGAVLDEPSGIEPWTPPPADAPLVVVAMPTAPDRIDALQRTIDALATLPVRGVVTTGPAVDARSLRPAAHVTVVASALHRQVLGHAAVAITDGDHGTVVRALATDVPMVIVPHGGDEADNAARVVARSAGRAVARTAPPAVIAKAVQAVLHDGALRNGATLLGSAIRADAASDALVHQLEALPGMRLWNPVDRRPSVRAEG